MIFIHAHRLVGGHAHDVQVDRIERKLCEDTGEDGGDAEIEFPFLRFVPEEIHPHERADAAAGDGHPDERILRDTPFPSTSLPLINPEDKESQDIDADEVYEECSQG